MLRAREYEPRWGRFLSPDPIGISGGLNLYAYVGARPLSDVDVNGLSGSRLVLPRTFQAESTSRFDLQQAIDRIWQPQMSKTPLDPTKLTPAAQTPWVLENASRITGTVQGAGILGDPQFYVRPMSNDAYHLYDKFGQYAGAFGVRSTATASAFQPQELAAFYAAPAVRAGKAVLSSLLKGGTSEGLEVTLGSDVALEVISRRASSAFRTFEEAFGQGEHVMEVIVRSKNGTEVARWWEASELGLGFGGHTEQKALNRLMNLGIDTELELRGWYPPCPYSGGCMNTLEEFARRTGIDITYRTPRAVYFFPGN
jgi:hypothetical protein